MAREERRNGIVVSVVSAWEIVLKQSLGKLTLDRDVRAWIAQASVSPGLRLEPLSLDDAMQSVLLPPPLQRDPADRFIVALARRLGAALVTSDRGILAYDRVDTVW